MYFLESDLLNYTENRYRVLFWPMAHIWAIRGPSRYRVLPSRVIGGTYTPAMCTNYQNTLFVRYAVRGANNTLEHVIRVPSAHRRVMRILGFI